jgi:hypothetical protein
MLKQKKIAGILGVMMIALTSLSASNVKPNGCDGPVLCPSFPVINNCSKCCYTWDVDIGLLYQQPGFANMSPGYAYQPIFQNPPQRANRDASLVWVDQTSKMIEAQYDYTAGLTVGLGYLLKHDNWYVGLNFDYLGASTSKVYQDSNTKYRPSSDFAFQAMAGGELNYPYGTWGNINYKANTDIYVLGAVLSRGSYHSNTFSYEPFAGVKALWFDNNQTKKYQSPDNPNANSQYILSTTQDNWGVGPMFGVNGEYHIISGISIFTDSSVGVLYGKNSYSAKTFVSLGADIETDRNVTNSGNIKNVVYVPVRTVLGFKLSSYFLEESHYVALKIGYDVQAVLSTSNKTRLEQGWEAQRTNADVGADVSATPIAVSQVINISNDMFLSGLNLTFVWNF